MARGALLQIVDDDSGFVRHFIRAISGVRFVTHEAERVGRPSRQATAQREAELPDPREPQIIHAQQAAEGMLLRRPELHAGPAEVGFVQRLAQRASQQIVQRVAQRVKVRWEAAVAKTGPIRCRRCHPQLIRRSTVGQFEAAEASQRAVLWRQGHGEEQLGRPSTRARHGVQNACEEEGLEISHGVVHQQLDGRSAAE